MKSIGITGSIASGKSTVAKLMAGKKYPLFSADQVVTNLYKNKKFIQKLIKKFNLNKNENIKEQIKVKLKENKNNFKKLASVGGSAIRLVHMIWASTPLRARSLNSKVGLNHPD